MDTNKSLVEQEVELLTTTLIELKQHIDPTNRKKIAKKVKQSVRTVKRYLDGQVGKKQVAIDIVDACRNNIAERKQSLTNLSHAV